jgi:hypothetical protein
LTENEVILIECSIKSYPNKLVIEAGRTMNQQLGAQDNASLCGISSNKEPAPPPPVEEYSRATSTTSSCAPAAGEVKRMLSCFLTESMKLKDV